MPAALRINEDQTQYEVEREDGQIFAGPIDEDGFALAADPDVANDSSALVAVLLEGVGLPIGLYKLSAVPCEIEDVEGFDEEPEAEAAQ